MLEAATALVARNRTVPGRDGPAVSLCDLGYCSVGVDEGWEGCGEGVNGTQHDAQGYPTIETRSFPDTAAMVVQIHKLGLSAGWYLNGCKCGERTEHVINYEGVHLIRGPNRPLAHPSHGCAAHSSMGATAMRRTLPISTSLGLTA
jgi:hypothetical protein